MRLNVWPACIECDKIKLEKRPYIEYRRDQLGDYRRSKVDVIVCFWHYDCSRIIGQKEIEDADVDGCIDWADRIRKAIGEE